MDFAGYSYYELNFKLLWLIGLPVDGKQNKSLFTKLRLLWCFTIISCAVIVQLTVFITTEATADLILSMAPLIMVAMVVCIKYYMFYWNYDTEIAILEHIQYDWNLLHNEEEIRILRKYTEFATLLRKMFMLGIAPYVAAMAVYPFVAKFLDTVIPLDEPRQYFIGVRFEVFVDQNTHTIPLAMTGGFGQILGFITVVATQSLTILELHHACGIFSVVSYRLDTAFDDCKIYFATPTANYAACKKLTSAIFLHQRCISLVHLLSAMAVEYLLLFLLTTVATSMNLYRLSEVVSVVDNMGELLIIVVALVNQFSYCFLMNYIGQQIINHSNRVFLATYNAQWYSAPISARKMLLFIMQRSINKCVINMGGLYELSLEFYSSMLNLSFTYFTVLCSLRN